MCTPRASVGAGGSPPAKYWILLAERPDPPSDAPHHTAPVTSTYLHELQSLGVTPIVHSRWLHAVSARLSPPQRTIVQKQPFVRHVRPVATGPPSSASPDVTASGAAPPSGQLPLGASAAHLSRINAVGPLARGLDGHGVRVGFLDAHFRGLRHPAFTHLRGHDRLLGLRNFAEGRQGGNHGAGVASVAVGHAPGTLIGPAHGAQVLGASTEYTSFERDVEEDYFVAGLEWLHRRGADVVNVSIGYTTFDEGQDSYTPDDLDGDTGITTRAVDRAAQLGITVIVSAGNSGCATPDSCWYYVNTPADADSAITVGAITPDSSLADFSSRGPTADGRIKPDVVVPGTEVVAAWDDADHARVGGTSFAAPQVTGIVAQMLQVNPTLSPIEVRRLLRRTASQAQQPDDRKGWGVVDANAALRAAERRARATPPPSLIVESPYPAPADSQLTLPVRAPKHTSSVRLSLMSPLGEPVVQRTFPVEPGPNWLSLRLRTVPPGLYLYRLQHRGGQHTGTIAISP
ncbi:MAG: serine protease [Bacteroidetes bacterium SW_9_63_38]|nr:MAG: serine protease [Bacteroidetes bacterium SW_9_63_38]